MIINKKYDDLTSPVKDHRASALSFCTLTGVDEYTDLHALCSISRKYEFVEWGFLYSPKRQGQPGRYPRGAFLYTAFANMPRNVRVAMHVCGAGVQQLLHGEPSVTELFDLVVRRNGRIQLNFSEPNSRFDPVDLHAFIARRQNCQFITQHNDANAMVAERLQEFRNHSILFDSSGGRGLESVTWKAPLPGISSGYAGGLGPDNVWRELHRIRVVTNEKPFWIDMEGKLRKDDRFDLNAVESVLAQVNSFRGLSL